MTYEEKQQAKLERYQELSHKAEAESKNAYERSHRISEAIPFGQPILVGHHSEGRQQARYLTLKAMVCLTRTRNLKQI